MSRRPDVIKLLDESTITIEELRAYFDFKNAHGSYMRLDGTASDRLEATLNGNFGGLLAHHFTLFGYWEVGP